MEVLKIKFNTYPFQYFPKYYEKEGLLNEIKNNINFNQDRIVVGKDNVEIKTVEHILAAIAGNRIDNLVIEVDNIEIPILDGSSNIFCKSIKKAGTINQKDVRKYYTIKKRIKYV